MKKTALALFLLFLVSPGARAADVVERIVAVVNDEIVTEQDLMLMMAPVLSQYRTLYAGSEFQEKAVEARQEFLKKAIEDKLILSEAKRRQVIVKDEEVDEMLTEVRNKFPSRDVFVRAIEEQGLTEKKLWNRFRDQLLTQKLVGHEVKSKVSVSPGEVSEYYKAHQEEFMQNERVKLRHILVRTQNRSEADAGALAESLAARIRGGETFEAVAKEASEGAEAKEGGLMGWMERGQLMGEIDKAVFTAQPGEVVGPVKSSLGFHLFTILEKEEFSVRSLVDVRESIQEKLFKQKLGERLDRWIGDLKKDAYISIR